MDNKPKRVVGIHGGPGTGKSTTACALFAELKYRGRNTEYISEYAKGAAWEKRGKKVFRHQEYIFGKQHFNLSRVVDEVDFIITDSPLLLGLVYTPKDYHLQSLKNVIWEAYSSYDNIDIFLTRSKEKPFNPAGRNQNEEEAIGLDTEIKNMLTEYGVKYNTLEFGRSNVPDIIKIMESRGWL